MHLEGLAQFEKDRVLTEIPPDKDEKGESTSPGRRGDTRWFSCGSV